MAEWMRVLEAADAAARWHAHQRRKGTAAEPYVNHVLEVAGLVAKVTGGEDPNLVIAALLHDAVEDQAVPRAVIAERFGEDVAALVMEVTDDKSLPKDERKRRQIETAPHKSQRAKILKLADKISNLGALTASPPADWDVGRRLGYIAWAREVVAGLRGAHPALEAMFDETAEAAERALRP